MIVDTRAYSYMYTGGRKNVSSNTNSQIVGCQKANVVYTADTGKISSLYDKRRRGSETVRRIKKNSVLVLVKSCERYQEKLFTNLR